MLSSVAVVLLLLSAAAGDRLSGQWISEDSVYNHQNVFQIQSGMLILV